MALPVHLTMTSIWIHRLQHELTLIISYTILFPFYFFGGLKSLFSLKEFLGKVGWTLPQHKCSVDPWDCCMTKHFKHWFLWIYNLQIIYLKLSPCPFSLKIWPLSDILSHCTNLKILPYILYIYKAVARQINLQIASATMSGWFKVLSTVT